MHPEDISRVVHEANRAVQIIQADPTIAVSPSWDDLDYRTKQSALEGVHGVIAGNTPEESHAGWCAFKERDGWVLGDKKDEMAKTHPLLVPYEELSADAKLKDRLFVAIVNTLKEPGSVEPFVMDYDPDQAFVPTAPAPENN